MVIQESSEPGGEILLYQAEDGRTRIECRFEDDTVWLTQAQMAELFQTTAQNITIHLKGIYAEGEQTEVATCKTYLQVRREGGRRVQRQVRHYRLEVVLAVGFRRLSCSGASNHSEMPNSSFRETHPLFFPFTRYPAYHCVPWQL